VEEIRDNTGFELPAAPDLSEIPLPGPEVIELIMKIDPDGIRKSEFR